MELQPWGALNFPQALVDHPSQVVHVIWRVSVLNDLDGEVDLLVEAVALEERVVLGDVVVYFDAEGSSRLERPAASHVLDGVAAATDEQGRDAEAQHELEAARVALDAEVELPQLVVAETVRAQLHQKGVRTVFAHHARHYVLQ